MPAAFGPICSSGIVYMIDTMFPSHSTENMASRTSLASVVLTLRSCNGKVSMLQSGARSKILLALRVPWGVADM